MATNNKDFKVKNGLIVGGTGVFDGVVTVATPSANSHAATKQYVDTAISNLVDSAPGTLDTLNELAAALADDPSFATTITNSLAGKQDIVANVSSTEIGYLDGVTSAIQTQLDGKSPVAGSASITTVGTVTTATSPTAAGSIGLRNITISTAEPTGGADGDVWLVYT